jgi:hypothetical protein
MLRATGIFVLLLAAMFALAPGARAQQARLDITVNAVQACNFSAAPTIVIATVSVVNAYPFRTVRFKAPVPCGMIWVGDSSGNLLAGNSQAGVTITMPACTSISNFTPVPVLTITAITTTLVPGCTWDVFPADGDSDILLTDCDGNTMKGASARGLYCGDVNGFIGPYLPDPPDGATDVPLNTLLSFNGSANEIFMVAGPPAQIWNYPVCSVFPYFQVPACGNPFDPGLLQPYTTYSWVAVNACVYCQHGEAGYSDIVSFTTGAGPVATEQSTWGRVKARYRE